MLNLDEFLGRCTVLGGTMRLRATLLESCVDIFTEVFRAEYSGIQ